MFGSEILEIAVGLVFVYLVASLIATSIREAVEGIFNTRAIQLERGIRQLFDDPSGKNITRLVYDHPLLFSLFAGNYDPSKLTTFWIPFRRGGDTSTTVGGAPERPKRAAFFSTLPAYIPSGNFALALMHTVSGGGVLTMDSLTQGVMLLPEGKLKRAMLVVLGEAKGDLDRARKSVETWFDGTMDRISGWYKRETSWILFSIGLAAAVGINIDTINIAFTLASNNTLRQQLVAHADALYPALGKDEAPLTPAEKRRELTDLSTVIGWDNPGAALDGYLRLRAERDYPEMSEDARKQFVKDEMADRSTVLLYWFLRVVGWILSALAISLGAPFWFDVLGKLMIVRSTVKPFQKSGPEASADAGAEVKTDPLAPMPGGAATVPNALSPPNPGIPAQPTPVTATVRYAFDGANPGSIVVGLTTPVPASGFIELPLPINIPHTITATGTIDGQSVSWSQTQTVGLDDEQKPVAATLSRGSGHG